MEQINSQEKYFEYDTKEEESNNKMIENKEE